MYVHEYAKVMFSIGCWSRVCAEILLIGLDIERGREREHIKMLRNLLRKNVYKVADLL